MSKHAPLAPSAAARWGAQCPGSVGLEAANPEDQSPEAMEGDAAHWYAAETIRFIGTMPPTVAPNGVVITDEMIEGAQVYAEDVQWHRQLGDELHVEEYVPCTFIHPQNGGTPDLWLWRRDTMDLFIWDYKYGHRYVDVFENWQMLDYLAGILMDVLKIEDLSKVSVHFRLAQPRCFTPGGPVRSWDFNAAKIVEYWERLQRAAQRAFGNDPPTIVGPACRDCKGRHACEALQIAGEDACDVTAGSSPLVLPPAALSLELRMLTRAQELLKARITGLEAQATATIKSGTGLPGWQLQQGEGRLNWNVPLETVFATGDVMGVELRKPAAITPTQAIKAGLDTTSVQALSARPKGELKLVQHDDKQMRKVFG